MDDDPSIDRCCMSDMMRVDFDFLSALRSDSAFLAKRMAAVAYIDALCTAN